MAEKFYTILTNVGLAKIANSQVMGNKVNLVEMAVGDGNGAYYNPTSNDAALQNEKWRGPIGSVEIDEDNANWIVIETVIPSEIGGFFLREVGLFDEEGDLIAIGKYPETYKPVLDEGSAKDLYIRMIIEVSNASAVTLKVDPTVIIASRKYVDEKIALVVGPINQSLEDLQTLIGEYQQDLAAHLADYAKLKGDLSTLKTSAKDSIPNIVNELFTNVSDGKSLVGGAITDVDDSVVIPADPTFQQLADAIGLISTGKKWASGTIASVENFKMTVTGLEFSPQSVMLYSANINHNGLAGRFNDKFNSNGNGATVQIYHYSTIYNEWTTSSSGATGNMISFTEYGFSVGNFIVNGNVTNDIRWIAYE